MKDILCFGDSNTFGLIPGTTDRYPYEVRWTGRLDQMIRKNNYRIIEEGLCGRTTIYEDAERPGRNGSEQLPILLESHEPLDGIILMLGTNDCKSSYQATQENITAGIHKLITQIREYDQMNKILLISPIHLGSQIGEDVYDPEFDQRSMELSYELEAQYRQLALKCGCEFIAASDYVVPSKSDMEHMDAEGHARLADAIYQKLEDVYSWT